MSNNQSSRPFIPATQRRSHLIDFSCDSRILPGMAVVLCTGVEEGLVSTRKMMLERVGHTVIIAMTVPALIKACQSHAFHLAVVGQEKTPEIKRRVFALIRRHCPSAKILEVYPIELGRTLKGADDWLALPKREPDELIQRVAILLRSDSPPLVLKAHTRTTKSAP
jgi:CheY-like chemotaxis protein